MYLVIMFKENGEKMELIMNDTSEGSAVYRATKYFAATYEEEPNDVLSFDISNLKDGDIFEVPKYL